MVNSYETCSSAISIFLLILAILEIVITLVPLITVSDLLRFTGTHLAAVCGLVAGLITLPASIRLKFNETSPALDKLYGHSSFFKKLTLFVSLLLNIVAATMTVVALLTLRNFCQAFGRLMKVYHCNVPARVLVNLIQISLECCGSLSYKDWLSINWRMYEMTNDEDFTEEDNPEAVPYSCCNKSTAMACGHFDLRTYGTCSIYRRGCAKFLKILTKRYLWVLFTLYMINVALQVLLLVIYSSDRTSKHTPRRKRKRRRRERDSIVAEYSRMEHCSWDGASNCSKVSQRSSEVSNRSKSPSYSDDSECSNICEYSLEEDGTPELTSSHKQVRIFSALGKSKKNFKVFQDE
ncbi:hypothetical protein HHI36_017700 [Cryptolaemus montrouzieri]|uniref:Tetraspanin n=1 Tax=Cryptolaemus montrouzieri TaxID=559131 RepID=A0ABD2NNK3_9CUCU